MKIFTKLKAVACDSVWSVVLFAGLFGIGWFGMGWFINWFTS